MLKIVVFDTGYGGEIFADRLEEELGIVKIIRVIDWRNSAKAQSSKRHARKITEAAIRQYIGRVDLIIIANYFISITSLKYFRRHYKQQSFIGLALPQPTSFANRHALILATTALSKTINFRNYLHRLRRDTFIITPDDWPAKIDDGELSNGEIISTIARNLVPNHFRPNEIIIGCSHFMDLENTLRQIFGQNIKIYDDTDEAIRRTCKTLKLRGGYYHKNK